MNRRIEFESGGERCVGLLRLPKDLSQGVPRPAIIYCAGMSLTKEVWLPDHAERLRDAGFITLNFDYRYFGESGGEPRRRLLPAAQIEDTRNALSALAALDEVDEQHIGLYGMSLGASVAVGAAGRDPRAACVMAVAGPMDLERVWRAYDGYEAFAAKVAAARERFDAKGEISYISLARLLSGDPETVELLLKEEPKYPRWSLELSFESLHDFLRFRPEEVVQDIAPRPLLLVSPELDGLIAGGELRSAYEKAGEPKRLVELPGARHVDIYEGGRAFEDIVRLATEWFGEHIPVSREQRR